MFLLLKEIMYCLDNIVIKKVTLALLNRYFKNGSELIFQSDTSDLFILNSILELAFVTYKKNPIINEAAYIDRRDFQDPLLPTDFNKNTENNKAHDDLGFESSIAESERDRFHKNHELQDIFEKDFPSLLELSKHLNLFFSKSPENTISSTNNIKKELIDRYLYLRLMGYMINCADYGRSQVANLLKELIPKLEAHSVPLHQR